MEIEIYKPTDEEKKEMMEASDKIIDILDEFEDKFKVHIIKNIVRVMCLSEEELLELNRRLDEEDST